MAETAREAIDRVARVVTDQIADDAGLRTADQLEHGCMVKVVGDWFVFVGLTDQGAMRLWTDESEFFYGPTSGGRFVWHEGPF